MQAGSAGWCERARAVTSGAGGEVSRRLNAALLSLVRLCLKAEEVHDGAD
jgi:hypothetical protein